jgi:SAM-dependent methyltransferase
MTTFNEYQYADLQERSADQYANTKYDIILDYLKGAGRLEILNAGCGSGELSLRLGAKGHRVVGIDPEAQYIDLAVRNARECNDRNCRFAVSSIEAYDEPVQYDCAIATDVLEHIADDRTALSRLVQLVRPGGLVILTVPAGQWLFGYHDEQLGHFRRYSTASLRRLVNEFCEVDKIRYFGFSLIPICLLYSKWLRKPYPVAQAGDTEGNPMVARILNRLLKIDRRLPMPLGTSVIFKGRVRSAYRVVRLRKSA